MLARRWRRWRWGGLVLLVMVLASAGGGPAGAVPAAIAVPVLKWQLGGCYASWCETGWYASAAVADLDGDGASEVVGAAYSLFILEGADGTQRRNVDPPGSRVWPGVVVADLDADGDPEIVVATGDGYLTVLDHTGDQVWSRRPASRELRGLSAYDLDADGTFELIVTAAVGSRTNTWVYEHDGGLRAGWPQLNNDSGYAWGVFNDNAAVGDLDGDGMGEIIVPSDVHYICAYERDGAQIPAHTMYGDVGWGKVGLWESLEIELRGWGRCNGERDESYRPNFAHSPAALADVNGDGVVEVVATGNMYSCISGYPSRYYALYLLNADRSRFNDGVYDWREIPQDTGAPLVEDYNVIESVHPNPAVGDLDGDGTLEVVYPSYDGRVHAVWLDKTEHGAWPYAVYTGGPYRFASEAALADLDADGDAEVIFASWMQKGSGQTGQLHILDHLGNVVHEVDLPPAFGGASWNGALAAPTLANIDADADLEVVLNTAHSGLVAYDLPGTAGARVLWGTGRGNQARTGAVQVRSLAKSTKRVVPVLAESGETVTYTLALWNPGPVLPSVRVTDTLPLSTTHNGHLWASAGTWGVQGRVITWTGAVGDGDPVTLTYGAVISAPATVPSVLRSTALLDDGAGRVWERTAMVIVNGRALYLPIVVR